jgi:hypothetical protein
MSDTNLPRVYPDSHYTSKEEAEEAKKEYMVAYMIGRLQQGIDETELQVIMEEFEESSEFQNILANINSGILDFRVIGGEFYGYVTKKHDNTLKLEAEAAYIQQQDGM